MRVRHVTPLRNSGISSTSWSKIDDLQDVIVQDIFISYSDPDEAWVTGHLLEVIWNHFPQYSVCLQGHADDVDGRRTKQLSCQTSLASVSRHVDGSQLSLIIISDNFFKTLWNVDNYRTVILEKLESQRYQFIFVFLESLDLEGIDRDLYAYTKENKGLRADDPMFGERLAYYMPQPMRNSAPKQDRAVRKCLAVGGKLSYARCDQNEKY